MSKGVSKQNGEHIFLAVSNAMQNFCPIHETSDSSRFSISTTIPGSLTYNVQLQKEACTTVETPPPKMNRNYSE